MALLLQTSFQAESCRFINESAVMEILSFFIPVVFFLTSPFALASEFSVESLPFSQQKLFNDHLEDIETSFRQCRFVREQLKEKNHSWVSTKVFHSSATSPQMQIYTYFIGEFDPKRPTMIVVDGGPGGNSHLHSKLTKNFNELHFDQRGIVCSQPPSLTHLTNPDFYSSTAIAHDIEAIRQHYGLKTFSLYASSYGTVPATIYASLYPKNLKALVLEGVQYNSNNKVLERRYIHHLQRLYDSLSPNAQKGVDAYFTQSRSHNFSQLAFAFFRRNDGFNSAKKYLEALFFQGERFSYSRIDYQVLNLIKMMLTQVEDLSSPLSSAFDFDSQRPHLLTSIDSNETLLSEVKYLNLHMINCRENPGQIAFKTARINIQKGQFTLAPVDPSQKDFCSQYEISVDHEVYSPKSYPIQVPITYFQGELDSATGMDGALKHFLRSSQSQAQLLIAKHGGHGPLREMLLGTLGADSMATHMAAFEKSLRGEFLTSDEIKIMNKNSPVQWEQSLRDKNLIYQASPLTLQPLL